MFPISNCLKGVRSKADLQVLSVVMTYNAKTLGTCVWDLALLPQPLRIFREERWDMSGCYSIQTLYSGACKIQLFQRSPAQRVLLAWQALDLEVQGKLNPLDGRGGCPFLVSSPLLTASLKPEQSCALTWFLLSSASIYSAKKIFLLSLGTKLPGGARGCDHSLPCTCAELLAQTRLCEEHHGSYL